MSDTSNKFSLNGLNRQKKLSGLHARRPENIDKYFDSVVVPLAPTFVSILGVKILSSGSDYSNDIKVSFPQPEHPNGIMAEADVYISIEKTAFNIINGGSNYAIGDSFNILSNDVYNQLIAGFVVTNVGQSGNILDFEIINFSPIKSSNSFFIDFNNTNANIEILTYRGYAIDSIVMKNYGSGYQTYSRNSGQTITHNPTLYNYTYQYGNNTYYYLDNLYGNGASIESIKYPIIQTYSTIDNRSRQLYTDKYESFIISSDYIINYYYLINNYSLNDPTRG